MIHNYNFKKLLLEDRREHHIDNLIRPFLQKVPGGNQIVNETFLCPKEMQFIYEGGTEIECCYFEYPNEHLNI